MSRRPFIFIVFQCLLLAWIGDRAVAAPYTYVDATPANTTLNGAALVDRNAGGGTGNFLNQFNSPNSTGSIGDGFWSYRNDPLFEGGGYFDCDSGTGLGDRETTAPLRTSVTLGAVGTYEIVAIFTRTSNRDIAARIGAPPGSAHVFTTANALNADQSLLTPDLLFDASYGNKRGSNAGAAHLGQVTTTVANQSIAIHINGLESTADLTIDERTQYDGIGFRLYQAPEPKHRDVFLIAGQSNADGRGLKAELTGSLASYAGPQSVARIHYTNTAYTNADKSRYKKWMTLEPGYSVAPGYSGTLPSTTFGVEIGAAKVLSAHVPNPTFIKVARGGTALGNPGADWYPAPLTSSNVGPLYKAFIESTQLALQEIAAAGDTYTVHGIYWHQGESDSGNVAGYGALLTTLIESVRRDLGMPKLRFIIGELANTKDPAFRNVQWQIARSVPNAAFLSSHGLATFEGTHFTTAAMITFGERLGHAFRGDRDTLNFNIPTCATGPLDRQDECAANSGITVETTAGQGEYNGGQAVGHKGSSGSFFFTRRHMLPLDDARTMQADFFPGDAGYDNEADADSSLLVAGWAADAGNDGLFSEAETAIGFGVHHTGTFRIQVGANAHPANGFNYQTDRWYRLTLRWSEPDPAGNRMFHLFARDLSTGVELNGGAAILSLAVSANDFGTDPLRWLGIGCRSTRGLMDNIRIVPPGFASWMDNFHPTLEGGPGGDDDRDGIANVIEFAFGLNPLRPDSSSTLPQPIFGPAAATVAFTPLPTQPELVHTLEWSRNLASWQPANGVADGGLVRFTVPTIGESRVFIRQGVVVWR